MGRDSGVASASMLAAGHWGHAQHHICRRNNRSPCCFLNSPSRVVFLTNPTDTFGRCAFQFRSLSHHGSISAQRIRKGAPCLDAGANTCHCANPVIWPGPVSFRAIETRRIGLMCSPSSSSLFLQFKGCMHCLNKSPLKLMAR